MSTYTLVTFEQVPGRVKTVFLEDLTEYEAPAGSLLKGYTVNSKGVRKLSRGLELITILYRSTITARTELVMVDGKLQPIDESDDSKCPNCHGVGWDPTKDLGGSHQLGTTADYCPVCFGSGSRI